MLPSRSWTPCLHWLCLAIAQSLRRESVGFRNTCVLPHASAQRQPSVQPLCFLQVCNEEHERRELENLNNLRLLYSSLMQFK